MVKYHPFVVATSILFMLVAFPININAQSKHVSLWRIGDYCLDFNNDPPTFYQYDYSKLSSLTTFTRWYVDSNGIISLLAPYDEGKMAIFDKDANCLSELSTDYQFDRGIFVPKPGSNNEVYYIEADRYFVIDMNKKTVVLNGNDINLSSISHIAVHHSDCNNVWLINTDKKVWTTYLITSSGIEKDKEISLNESDYTSFPSTTDTYWDVNLSKDCKHYTMSFLEHHKTEVYYGDFDRTTGTITCKSRYNFGSDYLTINNSIIAADNSRIYYVCTTSQSDLHLIEVPILEGLPDYSKLKTIYSEHKFGALAYRSMIYGFDDIIYLIDYYYQKISTIEIDNMNKTIFIDNKFAFSNKGTSAVRNNFFLSSWFMDNPCDGNTIPSISLPDVCTSQTKTYSVDNSEQGIVYYWEVAGGELSATTGSEVSVKWADTEGNGTLCVYSKHIETGCVSDKIVYSIKRKKAPTVEFDNASVCYGEPLKVMLSGTAPFEVFYTLDGETNSFKTDISEYQMDNISGNYQLIKVTDGNACEASPTDNNTAIIVSKLQKLIIKELK